jgi:hypothetical protein
MIAALAETVPHATTTTTARACRKLAKRFISVLLEERKIKQSVSTPAF